ncbi:MAG TPA: Crp/Fnr family transcriptional regulator, partial [Thermoanaerobaculia bacterium]
LRMRRSPYGFEVLETCTTCSWRTEQFFCAVGPDVLAKFEGIAFTNVYPTGSLLFSEGETARAVYVLCKGAVKLSIASGDGKTLITHIARPGEALGISSVIAGHEYRTTAETLEPSQVKVMRRDDFLRFATSELEASRRVAHQLSMDCEAANDHVRAIGLSRSAAEKLAHLVVTWAEESGRPSDQGTRVQVLMTHHDISQLIGTSRETVTRLLKEFREKGILSVKGSTLTIHNRAALEALVSM